MNDASEIEAWVHGRPLATSVPEMYDRFLVPAVFGPWADEFLHWFGVHEGDRVLDLACGTGALSDRLRPRVGVQGRVVGLDLNPLMLAVARSHLPKQPIPCCQADAARLPFRDCSLDAALCHHGLQLIVDHDRTIAELHRVVRPGGRVGLSVWASIDHSPGYRALATVMARHFGDPIAERYRQGPFGYGLPARAERTLRAAGFTQIQVETCERPVAFPSVVQFVRCYLEGPPFSAASPATRARILAELESELHEFVTPTGLSFPIKAHFARAYRP
jgi:ubiquinone/menaquinone biosynthesis C-methylase UbiE